jgi:hypothetical protein
MFKRGYSVFQRLHDSEDIAEQLSKDLSQKDAEIQELSVRQRQLVDALKKAGELLINSEAKVMPLQARVSRRDATIATQKTSLIEAYNLRDAAVAENLALKEVNKKISADNAVLAEANKKIAADHAVLTEANKKIAADHAVLAEANKKITADHAVLAEANKKITADHAVLAEANEQIIADNAVSAKANKKLTADKAKLAEDIKWLADNNAVLAKTVNCKVADNDALAEAKAKLTTDHAVVVAGLTGEIDRLKADNMWMHSELGYRSKQIKERDATIVQQRTEIREQSKLLQDIEGLATRAKKARQQVQVEVKVEPEDSAPGDGAGAQ